MRIIAGEKRGMAILGPKTDSTRPITDRVKESVFNVLQKYGSFEGAWVGDLFCGTGSTGLEALSRGAAHVLFVEQDLKVVEILKKNITKGRFEDRARIARANAFKIGAASLEKNRFDFVFVDPPYALSRDVSLASPLGGLMLTLGSQLSEKGVAIVRTEAMVETLEEYGRLKRVDRRTWGTMAVAFYMSAGAEEEK